jgi:hypothetical protein
MPENEQEPTPPSAPQPPSYQPPPAPPPAAAPPTDQPLYYPPPNYPPPNPQWPPQPQPYGNYPGYAPAPPVNSTLVLVFGILGIIFTLICGFGGVFGIAAWIMGNSALATLDRVGDPMNQRSTVNAGRICGIVGTVLMILSIVAFVAIMVIGIVSDSHHAGGH